LGAPCARLRSLLPGSPRRHRRDYASERRSRVRSLTGRVLGDLAKLAAAVLRGLARVRKTWSAVIPSGSTRTPQLDRSLLK
jgi:hypothetical protein